MATLFHAEDSWGQTQEKVSPKNGKYYSLEELQGYVGGYIEIVYLDDENILVVNENGKVENLPYNIEASCLFSKKTGRLDFIAGNALLCKSKEVR